MPLQRFGTGGQGSSVAMRNQFGDAQLPAFHPSRCHFASKSPIVNGLTRR